MKLKGISKEELEMLTYDEIAYKILETTKKKMKINELFKEVCDILELSEDDYLNHITEFFETLTTNQKFIMLENGYWDIRARHSSKIVVEEDDDEYEESIQEEDTIEEEKDNYYDEDDIEDDDTDDDLKDLVVIDDLEDEEN